MILLKMMRVCSICKIGKDLAEFYLNPGTTDGRGSQCKSCDTKRIRERGRERKKRLVEVFGGKCSKCGYDKCIKALEFHHENGDKDFSVSRSKNFDDILKEAKKCILVCANCHRELHARVGK